jgi:hypothetical protein
VTTAIILKGYLNLESLSHRFKDTS